jgi:shikimate kinase
MATPLGTRHVVVVGLMATGKSTVGRAVAAHLDLPYLDNDTLLEARCGRTAAELQAERGQAELHRHEAAGLRDALASPRRSVICAAASVADDDAAVDELRRHDVVWLTAAAEELADRVRTGSAHRPDQGPALLEVLREQQARRDPRYAEVADVHVDTTSASSD